MQGIFVKNNIEGVIFMSMNIKKIFYITSVIVVACVIASSVITVLTAPAPMKTRDGTSTSSVPKRVYVLTQRQGRVTAYIKGVEVPYIETTTAVNSLPHDVQARLLAGIEFESEEELRRVMDEYCS